MKDYDVWYNGTVVGNLQAKNQQEADAAVKAQYSKGVFGYPTAVEDK